MAHSLPSLLLRLAVAVAVAAAVALVAVFLPSGVSSAHGSTSCGPLGPTGEVGPSDIVGTTGRYGTTGPAGPTGEAGPFGRLDVRYTCTGGTLDSVHVTVTDRGNGGIEVYVLHRGSSVYSAKIPAGDLSPPNEPFNAPPGQWSDSRWSGALVPSEWKGGCQRGTYLIGVGFIRRLYGEDLITTAFTCRGD